MGTPPSTNADAASAPPTRTRGPRSIWALAAAGIAIGLVSGLLSGAVVYWATDDDDETAEAAATSDVAAASCVASTVAAEVQPSVVTLLVSNGTSGGNGSGEVIRDGGYILTNDHVISPAGSTGTIDVLFSGGQTVRATVVGRAPEVDLAVVRADPPEGVSTIPIGRSAPLKVGQPVVALGSPLGLTGTVTSGIVSALGRDVPVPSEDGQTAVLPGAIQTDAAINPGNSGGALVDCAGKLIGVNTAIATVPTASGDPGGGSVGLGFAIPVDVATVVADQLIDQGKFSPPYLGMVAVPIPAATAERFGVTHGLFVQSVTSGGPAEQAGLRPRDVITAVDGRPTAGADSLFLAVVSKKPGDQVAVEYTRAGTAERTTLTLGSPP
ncbi:S1C family serine protease [Cryptosporangium aurantiacum]|uniref:Putative serine protease PepD n=1 Tax=Cryptosporangium aurantiacum TaxID=134849 RepID=A0A1M7R1H1_9ACTN|nr:trypsin-like peptidase domain-containing protein [Cryptosporangium aurantiacum]SHN38679.1 putative serine protease PepD [Cryptosporangium aurantiacum]